MTRLSLSLLGPFQVTLNEKPVAGFRSDKERALLTYLAVEADTPHRRASLVGLLWPDYTESAARNNLRQALFRLRQAIGDSHASPPFLLTTRASIQFNPNSDYWLDVAAFTALLSACEAHRHHHLETCQLCIERLQQAIELYQGDFLKDFFLADSAAFEEWVLVTREQLLLRALEALRILEDYHERRGEYEQAQQYALRQVELMPWREVAHRRLMRLLALSGQRSAALAQYETCRRLLAEELGVEPEDETRALMEQIRAGALVDMHPRIPITQLPAPATPFVGREAERKQLADYLVGQDQRLITLYGPGGIGKTRLALEIAAEQVPFWRDGVWFIPLAREPDAEGLVDALASTLHLEATSAPLEAEQLIHFLRPKELLLILDSFEHLMAGRRLLQDILRWAPRVSVLVTSRARLGLREEWAISLGGLDVPPDTPATAVEALTSTAVQLFLQSARQVNPEFTLSPENMPHVVRICRLVAGLPLGIELAAAWVRLFPCRQIADEIERSPDFLHNPGENPSGRQSSLRATFEYSYSLLSDTEQALFRKLSVFHGGFTADAAQQVAGSGPFNLVSLLDKSLLQVSPFDYPFGGVYTEPSRSAQGRAQGRPSRRLDLHLTLKQYAAEKLAEAPQEQRETRERHCRTYLPFVQKREETLWAESPKETLEEIDVERGNVREAWRWAVSQGKIEAIDASIRGLSRFYDLRGLLQEAAAAFESAAARVLALVANDIEAQRVAGRLLTEQARFLSRQALYAQVIQVAQVAVELTQASQDKLCEASATYSWGEALWRQGNHEEARTQLERALFLARAARDVTEGPADRLSRVVEMGSLNMLGGLCWLQGDYAGARAYIEQALHIAVKSGHRQDEARFLMNLGVLAVEQGNYAEAGGILQQSLHIQRAIGDRRSESLVLGNLGNVLLYLGAYAEAKTHYEQALCIQREIGAQKDESLSVGNLGLVYHYLGQHETARDYSQQALEIAQRIGERRAQGAMRMKLGHALAGLGQLDEAAHAYQESVTLRREMGWHNVAMEPLAGLARVALAQGHYEQAQAHVEEILNHLETGAPSANSGHGLDGTINPFQVYLTCYRVLKANQDPRAQEILDTTYHLLHERSAKIIDEEMRRSFLENVAAHREIVNEFSRATTV